MTRTNKRDYKIKANGNLLNKSDLTSNKNTGKTKRTDIKKRTVKTELESEVNEVCGVSVKDSNKKIGGLGENIAIVFLEKRGFQIIDRNHRNKIGELDIVAQKDDFYYVVEVKTLKIPSKMDIEKGGGFFDPNISIIRDGDKIDWLKPEMSLTKEKIQKIKQTTLRYCADFGIKEESVKFLGMCVSLYHYGSRVTKENLLSCRVKIVPLLN
jgi:hypothetical protein